MVSHSVQGQNAAAWIDCVVLRYTLTVSCQQIQNFKCPGRNRCQPGGGCHNQAPSIRSNEMFLDVSKANKVSYFDIVVNRHCVPVRFFPDGHVHHTATQSIWNYQRFSIVAALLDFGYCYQSFRRRVILASLWCQFWRWIAEKEISHFYKTFKGNNIFLKMSSSESAKEQNLFCTKGVQYLPV